MTELRTLHWTDNAILNAAMRNDGYRAMASEIAAMMMFLMHGKTANAGSAGVLGGFELATVPGQRQVTISPGWGWFYDTTLAPPASPFAAFNLLETRTLTLAPGHATWDRYDLISIRSQSVTDTVQSVPFWQAAPQNIATQRGSRPTLTVTAGTPQAFPFIPSTPPGHIALGAVRVPAGASNLDGAERIDLREHLGLSRRDSEKPIRFKSIPHSSTLDTKPFHLMEVLQAHQADGTGSKLTWDRNADWPAFQRSTTDASEDTEGAFFPMAIPGGRTWWRSVSWLGYIGLSTPVGLDVTRQVVNGAVGYYRTAAVAGLSEGSLLTIPTEDRSLQVVGASLRFYVSDPFNGNPVSGFEPKIELWCQRSGSSVKIASAEVDLSTIPQSPPVDLSLTMHQTPVLKPGDTLYAKWAFSYLAGGARGAVHLYSVSVQFQEGRAG